MAATVQDVIMLFGDSLTQGGFIAQGFAQQLSYVYCRKLDVINRGFSGYNTTWALPIFDQCFAKQHEQQHVAKVRMLVIWFGANDACIEPSPQHVPLPEFVSNLQHTIRAVTSPRSAQYSPLTRIILITPPPVNTHQRGADLASRNPPQKLDRLFDTTKAYAKAVTELGSKESIPVVDIWQGLYDAAGRDEAKLAEFLYDGLHLNEVGYDILYKDLMKTISVNYPELVPEKLQPVFPPWVQVDWKHPGPSVQARPAVVND